MPITHTDGKQYFSDDEVQNIVKDRVKSKDEEITAHKGKIALLEPQVAQVATLTQQVQALTTKATEAETRAGRVQVAASHGITDTETLWALEQAHARAMSAVPEAQRADFGTYLGTLKTDPTLAPSYLRGLFQQPAAPATPAGPASPAAPPATPAAPAPGAAPASPGPAAPAAGDPAAPAAPTRPAWAPAITGQVVVAPGTTPSLTERVARASTLDELAKISAERRK